MDGVIATDERGAPDKVEANLRVAVAQGRIAYGEVDKWRRTYQLQGYEKTTKALLAREANPDAGRAMNADAPRVGPGFAVGEGAYRDYAARCMIPGYAPTGFMRSEV